MTPYSITSSLNGLDGGSEAVGGDGEVLDKVVEELPVLSAVELLGLGVPDGGVGGVGRGGHCGEAGLGERECVMRRREERKR